MERSRGKRFPVDPNAYKLLEEIGDGVSATVHKALCIPLNETVAIKVLDLEKCSSDMDGIRREVQTMSLIDHPNVLRAHCSFPSGRRLWVVMPFMAGGSCLHIMKSAYPEGFEESVIATLLREVLKALVYLHNHGYIHRDVKAGNMLIDTNGAVKLADFGVSACLFDNGDRQRSWNTFVGTPCWMAPEVMQQLHGYDFKADVWSFGITALELAHGHAPFSKYPPMKVLLMTLQNAPPGLDYERDKRFSKSFKAMVGACLVKDPKKRPSAEKLLKHSFFKHARSTEYLARTILDGLIPLGERFRKLKARDADFLLQNKGTHEDEEHLSQQEYIRGVSAWNFNIEDLKAQAALIDDIAEFSPREGNDNSKTKNGFADDNHALDALHQEAVNQPIPSSIEESLDGSLASSFAMRPLQALRDCFDTCDDNTCTSSTEWQDATLSSFDSHQQSSQAHDLDADCHVNLEPCTKSTILERHNCLSGFLSHELVSSSSANASTSTNRQTVCCLVAIHGSRRQDLYQTANSLLFSSYTWFQETRSIPDGVQHEDLEGKVIQCRGRFKVTSTDVGPMGPSTSYCSSNPRNGSLPTSSVLPMLKFILQQNALQREEVTELIRFAEQTSGRQTDDIVSSNVDLRQFCSVSKRERNLQAYACELQQRISNFTEEIQNLKLQNAQLQKQLDNLSSQEQPREKDEPPPQ